MNIDPYKQDVIFRTRDGAIEFQSFVRALPVTDRFKIKAALYPDSSASGRFKISVSVYNRMGLMDGLEAIRDIRDYAKDRKTGRVFRGERELILI